MTFESQQILLFQIGNHQQPLSLHLFQSEMRPQSRSNLSRSFLFCHVNFFAVQFIGRLVEPDFGNDAHFEFQFANFGLVGGWCCCCRLFGLLCLLWFATTFLLVVGCLLLVIAASWLLGGRGVQIQPRLQIGNGVVDEIKSRNHDCFVYGICICGGKRGRELWQGGCDEKVQYHHGREFENPVFVARSKLITCFQILKDAHYHLTLSHEK